MQKARACYYSPLVKFDLLTRDKLKNDFITIEDDFNARVCNLNQITSDIIGDNSYLSNTKVSRDSEVKRRAVESVEFFESNGFIRLNGRMDSDFPANFTYCSNLGKSVIDLIRCNLDNLASFKNISVEEII